MIWGRESGFWVFQKFHVNFNFLLFPRFYRFLVLFCCFCSISIIWKFEGTHSSPESPVKSANSLKYGVWGRFEAGKVVFVILKFWVEIEKSANSLKYGVWGRFEARKVVFWILTSQKIFENFENRLIRSNMKFQVDLRPGKWFFWKKILEKKVKKCRFSRAIFEGVPGVGENFNCLKRVIYAEIYVLVGRVQF